MGAVGRIVGRGAQGGRLGWPQHGRALISYLTRLLIFLLLLLFNEYIQKKHLRFESSGFAHAGGSAELLRMWRRSSPHAPDPSQGPEPERLRLGWQTQH